MGKLNDAFYQRKDVVQVAKDLLGKHLCTHIGGKLTTGKIVETEAYKAPEDMGSHAYNYRKTSRTLPFYKAGGIAYVYLIYGTYHLFNVITGTAQTPHAVLVRGVEPVSGLNTMLRRRNMREIAYKLTAGPGLLSMALGITTNHNETDLQGNTIWIEEHNETVGKDDRVQSPRVGMNIPEPWKSMPWRFRIKNNPWASPAK